MIRLLRLLLRPLQPAPPCSHATRRAQLDNDTQLIHWICVRCRRRVETTIG